MARAGEFWRKALEGFSTPTPLVVASPPEDGAEPEYFEQQVELTTSESREVESLGRAAAVTLNTVVQAAWGLLLSRYSGEPDVVFGATVSGRPPELAEWNPWWGCSSTRCRYACGWTRPRGVDQWLRRLQDQQAEAREFEYTPLVEVQRWSEVPRETPLFESLLVFENYPDAPSFTAEEDPGGSEATDPSEPVVPLERTNYPLTVAVIPGDRICVRITYDANQIETHAITGMLGHYRALMVGMARHVGQPVSCISLVGEAERRRLLADWNDTGRDPGQVYAGLADGGGAGPAHADSTGGGIIGSELGGGHADIRAVERACESPGAANHGASPGTESTHRDLRRTFPRNGDCGVGRNEGRRRICAARPGVSEGAPGPDDGRRGRAGAAGAYAPSRPAAAFRGHLSCD